MWAPLSHYEDVLSRFPHAAERIHLDSNDLKHAFVIGGAEEMGSAARNAARC
jgi:hypothetical protein